MVTKFPDNYLLQNVHRGEGSMILNIAICRLFPTRIVKSVVRVAMEVATLEAYVNSNVLRQIQARDPWKFMRHLIFSLLFFPTRFPFLPWAFGSPHGPLLFLLPSLPPSVPPASPHGVPPFFSFHPFLPLEPPFFSSFHITIICFAHLVSPSISPLPSFLALIFSGCPPQPLTYRNQGLDDSAILWCLLGNPQYGLGWSNNHGL